MTPIPRVLSLATAVPPYVLRQEDVMPAALALFTSSSERFSQLEAVYTNTNIDTRYSCVPLSWYSEPHDFTERNRLYVENAVDLLERAAVLCIERAGLSIADVDGIVVASSTGIATPTLDALLMERLKMRRDLQRLPIFGLGCAGGVIGMARAAAQARAEPDHRILFLVVELCGLTFRFGDRSKSNIIATALFGDGAAGALISCAGSGPAIVGWGEHTFPDSLDVMGWDVRDDGLAVVFSRHIPALIRDEMRTTTTECLARQGLSLEDIDCYVCHPGGAKVLDALEEVFGLPPGGLQHSRRILRAFGNMSAATVLFVLKDALASSNAGRYLMSSLGPGFTAGFLTLEAT